MANDSVFISGFADGAIGDALQSLPAWANQETAKAIEGILLKSLKLQTDTLSKLAAGGKSGKGSATDTAHTQTELDKLGDAIGDANDQLGKDKKFDGSKNDQYKKDKKYWDAEKEARAKELAVEATLLDLSYKFEKVFAQNIATFDSLSEAGINVMSGFADAADGFTSLRELTAITGVRFSELSSAMAKSSTSINQFGFGKFAKTVGMASAGLTSFGYNSKESAELLGEYLTVQQNTSDVSKKTAEETSADLQKFGSSIFKLSVASGMSRAAIVANVVALSASTDANVLAGQIGQQSATSMTTFLASFKDQNIAKQILKLMSDPIKPLNESFMNLQKVGMGGFAQSFSNFTKSLDGMPEETKQQALKSFVEAHRGEMEQQKQRLALLKQGSGAVAGEASAALDLIAGLTQQSDAITRMSAEDLDRMEKSNAASKELSTAFEKLKALIFSAISPTASMISMLTKVITVFTYVVSTIIDGLASFSKILTKFSGIDIDIASWAAFGVVAVGAVSGLSIFTKVLKAFMMPSGIKGMLSKVAGSKGEEGAGGAAGKAGGGLLGGLGKGLSGLGKGLAGLGKGIGGGIGGVLKGLADGLKELGSGKVLLGVLALAGIGAALWVAGKAIKEFVGIDWETMAKAGVTLVALGVAGAAAGLVAPEILMGALAFGAMGVALLVIGEAIQAVGTGFQLFANSLDTLSNIDGAKLASVGEGLDALTSSSKLGLIAFGASALIAAPGLYALGAALEKISKANGIGVVSTAISSLSSSLGSFKGLDVLQSVVDTVNSLNIVKALTLGALVAITGNASGTSSAASSGVSLPPPTTTDNVSAGTTPRASTLNSPSAVSADPTVGGDQSVPKDVQAPSSNGADKPAVNTGVETALGYQSSILQQLLESTNSLISVNKDILRYTKVNN